MEASAVRCLWLSSCPHRLLTWVSLTPDIALTTHVSGAAVDVVKLLTGVRRVRPLPTVLPAGAHPVHWRSRWDTVYVASQLSASFGRVQSTPGGAKREGNGGRDDSSLENSLPATRNTRKRRWVDTSARESRRLVKRRARMLDWRTSIKTWPAATHLE